MASYTFLTLGDWGGAALEEPSKPYAQNVKNVASALKGVFSAEDVRFLVNTGDNFYWCGIQNTSDFQVQADWVDTYADSVRAVPWYSVLGNHEYGYNVQAQIDLSNIYPSWVMPARYYTKRVSLSSSQHLSMIFLDSSPCVSEYRSSSPSRWDPCGSYYPTCSLSGGHDDFEGTCHFNANILSQDCGAQLSWFKTQLAAVPKDDWLILVGHHPLDEFDVEDFVSAAEARGFDLYLNGHAHTLTHYMVDGSAKYVTSGAGALVMTYDQLGGSPVRSSLRSHARLLLLPLLLLPLLLWWLTRRFDPCLAGEGPHDAQGHGRRSRRQRQYQRGRAARTRRDGSRAVGQERAQRRTHVQAGLQQQGIGLHKAHLLGRLPHAHDRPDRRRREVHVLVHHHQGRLTALTWPLTWPRTGPVTGPRGRVLLLCGRRVHGRPDVLRGLGLVVLERELVHPVRRQARLQVGWDQVCHPVGPRRGQLLVSCVRLVKTVRAAARR